MSDPKATVTGEINNGIVSGGVVVTQEFPNGKISGSAGVSGPPRNPGKNKNIGISFSFNF